MFSFITISFFYWVALQGDLPFKQLVLKGDTAIAQFQNDQAIEFFSAAVKKDPQAFDSRIKLLRALNAKAQQLYYGESNKEAAYMIFKNNYEKAKELYAIHPKKPESPFALAVTAGNLALLSSPREKVLLTQDIEKNLLESVQLDPKFAYGYLGLGIFYKEISKITFLERFFAEMFFGEVPKATLEQAEFFLRKSLTLDSKFIFTFYHLGNCFERLERPAQAIDMYKAVLKEKSSDMNDPLWKQLAVKALKRLGIDATDPLESSISR